VYHSFPHDHDYISGFTNFIQTANPSKYAEDFYLARLWVLSFNCSLSESDCVTFKNCPHNASLDWLPGDLFDMTMSQESYNMYNAVYTVTNSLHEMFLHQLEVEKIASGKGIVSSHSQVVSFPLDASLHGKSDFP
jgi:vomeronasal 2 receptor